MTLINMAVGDSSSHVLYLKALKAYCLVSYRQNLLSIHLSLKSEVSRKIQSDPPLIGTHIDFTWAQKQQQMSSGTLRMLFFHLQGLTGPIGPPGPSGPNGEKVSDIYLLQQLVNNPL